MKKVSFSRWHSWEERNEAEGIKYPGVYICSITDTDISGKEFMWMPEIVYIGMTNSVNGLKQRLKQFDNTIIGKTGHGGADRVRYKYQNYNELVSKLYVSVASFECNVKSNEPKDLITMGEVAKFEYVCMAKYVELYGALPEFNNKKQAPKYSLTIERNKIANT